MLFNPIKTRSGLANIEAFNWFSKKRVSPPHKITLTDPNSFWYRAIIPSISAIRPFTTPLCMDVSVESPINAAFCFGEINGNFAVKV